MPLIPTTAHVAVVAAGTAHEFTRLKVGEGNRAVPMDVSTGWNVTALLTPFNPAREIDDPPGGASGNVHVVDWQDGAEGDAVAYTVNEIGLFATPTGGAEYLAFYESVDAGSIFAKVAGSVILRRLRVQATGAQLANSTFNVSLTAPAASESVAGVSELADNAEADAAEAMASASRVVTVAKWWRMFTGARIVARLEALTGNARLSYNSLQDTPSASPSVVALADGANIAWNWNSGQVATVTLDGDRTLSVPTNGLDDSLYLLRATQDATGGRSLTLHTSIDRGDVAAPSLSSDGGDTDVLGFMKWGGAVHYLGILKGY